MACEGTVSGSGTGCVFVDAHGGTLKIAGSGAPLVSLMKQHPPISTLFPYTTLFRSHATRATLKLDAPTAFTGWITQIVVGDTLDLAGVADNSATYSASRLTINETNGQQLTYKVSGSVGGNTVRVASDNHDGTPVYWA